MNVSIAVKQRKRQASAYNEIVFLINILEYMRKNKHPDFDYSEAFKKLRDILK